MHTNVMIHVFPLFALVFIGVIQLPAQAPGFKYNVEYVCNRDKATERVVVRYCRSDSDQRGAPATPDNANYCHVEYLDRPTNVPDIPLFKSELHSDIATKLSACKDPATGKVLGGSTTATTGAATADTSISKALAAKVDINILGMRFGDPLGLRDCPLLQLGPLKQNCFPALMDLVTELARDMGDDTVAKDVKTVTLIPSNCPSWVKDCTAYVTVHDGKLDGVSLFTNGRNAMNAVTRDLTAKYGKPTSIAPKTFKPDVGNPFSYNQPSWTLPGLRVTYDVVFNLEDDTDTERASSKVGLVRIMTEAEYLRRKAKEKKPVKSKL